MPAQRRRAHAAGHARAGRRRREPGPGDRGVHAADRRGGRRAAAGRVRAAQREPRLRREHERGLPRHRAGRRGDRQLRHRRARRGGSSACAPPPTRTGWWRPPARSPTTARSSPSPGATAVAAAAAGALDHRGRRAHRARIAAAVPADPDRGRALPLHPALGARARRRVRRDVLARLRRGGRLLPALRGARALARGGRRPLRLPPRRGHVRDAAE